MKIKNNHSILLDLVLVITIVVTVVMLPVTVYIYNSDKVGFIDELKKSTQLTLKSISKNTRTYIESYAINDYKELLETEIEKKEILAIVVYDYNMANIRGQDRYIVGKIKTQDWNIEDYLNQNRVHQEILKNSFYQVEKTIYSNLGEEIGLIKVYASDRYINERLKNSLYRSFIVGTTLSVLLTVILYFVIIKFVLRPITKITDTLKDCDKDGIPKYKLQRTNTKEANQLVEAINFMVDAIKKSRLELKDERDRFQLAVDGSNDGIWDWNPKNNKVFFSHRWKEMIGYSDDEIGEDLSEWQDRVHPDDLEETLKLVGDHLNNQTQTYESKHRMRCKDGSWIWVLDRGKAKFDKYGNVIRVVGFHTDITKEMEREEDLKHTATHDLLTNLPNRFLFNEVIQTQLHRTKRNKNIFALLFVDLDGFKEINDAHGHDIGDDVLITVAKRMKEVIRGDDVLARLGGDEFVIGLADLEDRDQIIPLVDRLLKNIEKPMHFDEVTGELFVSASIGISLYMDNKPLDPETLLRQADHAMYEAKTSGKRQYKFFNG